MKRPIKRALISVYDKSGLIEFAKELYAHGVEIVSTGSTAATIAKAGIPVVKVEELTGFPESLDGRVKTLHPIIHAGILADLRLPSHVAQLAELKIAPFDLVVVNLYPFVKTVKSGASIDECIEQIDIGGPSMVRGAAKNHPSVAVLVSPNQYPQIVAALTDGGTDEKLRRQFAIEAYRTTAKYDIAVSTWLNSVSTDQLLPEWIGNSYSHSATLRYGENPHQSAALYLSDASELTGSGVAGAIQLHGKEMSYNNYVDVEAAWRAAYDHADPAVAIIKHTNPCGIAVGTNIESAYLKAHACDPISAFGGVIAANREVNETVAKAVSEVFTEVIAAPSFTKAAIEILSQKPSIRILTIEPTAPLLELRPILGGVLVQNFDRIDAEGDAPGNWQLVAGKAATPEQLKDLQFAWKAVRAVKSNAILLANDLAAVGIGMGQVNRVDSARLAVSRAGDRASGSVAASDAFFPFADGLEILLAAGVSAIVQPGGSVRDHEVIEAANKMGATMYFTGVRHFAHA
ncbi:MAG: bifunctional phosphoribosylaminoimidazolecarboxamide formyltransferase/IMP cyclohydrolase [Candidatus Nanopelagicaceae bacterium]|nr:bifunctional phosphoribosylaminoimidazolecarboxamide formyltransferase/IMP cyclohydrolase [Candidatus Nanopelagicaceae bacterium]